MLDEWVERKVDWLCEAVPRFVRPRAIRLAGSGMGWHILLYLRSMASAVGGALVHIRSDEDMDLFLRETAERSDEGLARMAVQIQRKARYLVLLDNAGLRMRFVCVLYLMALCALGTLYAGGREMAVLCASLCLLWLSCAMEIGYAPVCRGVRQQYLMALMLRYTALGMPLLAYFPHYLSFGIIDNVVLQCAMLIMLAIHMTFFMTLTAFNRHQPLLLRMLSGVLGILPALTAACAIALCAAVIFREPVTALVYGARALGTVMVFFSDALMSVIALGGIRLKYHSIWVWLLMCGGCTLMVLAAWLSAGLIL